MEEILTLEEINELGNEGAPQEWLDHLTGKGPEGAPDDILARIMEEDANDPAIQQLIEATYETKQYRCNRANYTYGRGGNSIQYIVMHYTAGRQTAEGAALANCQYFGRESVGASAHYFIDDGYTIWQSVPDSDTAWHAGNWSMNQRSIGIEVCTAGDYTAKEIERAAWLVQTLMQRHGIPASRVIRHYDVTGKQCPAAYVNASKWATLHKQLTSGKTSDPTKWDGVGIEYAGANRYETCEKIAKAAHPKATHFMYASGQGYADAITGMWRAGQLGAQLLYKEVPLTLDDVFIGGKNRYGTNRIFTEYQVLKGAKLTDTCLVVNGNSWVNGAIAGPLAANYDWTIIYYEDHPNFYAQIAQYKNVLVIGGTVSTPKFKGETKRLAGETRYSTAVAVAEAYADSWDTIYICGADSPSDSVAAGQMGKPILFAGGTETIAAIKKHKSEIKNVVWFGGLASVTYSQHKEIVAAAGL